MATRKPKYDPKTDKTKFPFSVPAMRGDVSGKYNYGSNFVKDLPPKNKSRPDKKK